MTESSSGMGYVTNDKYKHSTNSWNAPNYL